MPKHADPEPPSKPASRAASKYLLHLIFCDTCERDGTHCPEGARLRRIAKKLEREK